MQATIGSSAAASTMLQLEKLTENEDAAVGPAHGDKLDMPALTLTPRDMLIPGALLSYGAFAFAQASGLDLPFSMFLSGAGPKFRATCDS